jgi:plastocyanin/DNA-binding beta-propeller fold protein YncE
MDNRLLLLAAIIASLLLAFILLPRSSGPAYEPQNWMVLAGADGENGRLQALRFLPEVITIHVGDSVTWKLDVKEEHTIYFTAGGPVPALEVVGPDGREYLNSDLIFASARKTYDGRGPISGGMLSTDANTYTLTFTQPGVYTYLCAFHPGMEGTITVLPINEPLPSTRLENARAAQREAQVTLQKARELHAQMRHPQVIARPDGSTEYVLDLIGDPQTLATVLHFEPSPLHIKAGDTVTWRMLDPTEAHTVTFPEDPENPPEFVLVEPQPNGPPQLLLNPLVWKRAGSETHGGHGYFNSGFLIRPEGEPAPTYSLTFTEPGSYEYFCLVHTTARMKGTIIVEPSTGISPKEPPILAIVDYTSHTGKAGEADGVAIVDLNPHSMTFGKIFQQVSIGPGVSPHHLYYNRDGSKLYTTALGGAHLYRIEMAGDRIQQVVPIDTGPCQVGEDLYFTEDGSKYYLTCMGSHMVMIFDAYSDILIGQIQAPAPDKPYIRYPHGISVDERLDRMIITETVSPALDDAGASVTVVELSTGRVLSTHPITRDGAGGTAPVEVFFLPGRRVAYITAMFEGTLWAAEWDAYSSEFRFQMVEDLTARRQGIPLEMYIGPDGYFYLSFGLPGGVNVYDISDPMAPKLLKTLPADAGAHHIAFSEDGKHMFVQNNLLNLEDLNAGTISVVNLESGQLVATVDAFVKQGLQPASLVLLGQPDHHGVGQMPMMPTPAQGFALHIDAKKHINELPDFVVHHYCKTLDSNVIQCLLFESDEPNARLIGAETIISPDIYAKLPEEERAYWHYHRDEIPLVDAKLPGLSEEEIQKVVAAVEDTYGKVVIFWIPGTPAPVGIPSVVNPQSQQTKKITIKAKDYAFAAPVQVESGLVSITLENDGAEPHHVQLARLRDGVTMKDVQDALIQSEEAIFPLVEWTGGVGVLPHGGRQEVLLDLREGHYLLLCFVASPDGVPHLAKGMIKSIDVVAHRPPSEWQEPKHTASVTLLDFAFQMPAEIRAGQQIWKITNEGYQPHELTVIKLASGKTFQDVLSFFQVAEKSPQPFEFAGGMQALSSAKTGWLSFNLAPGDYVALCFVPDPETNQSHVELGMVFPFVVK